MASYVEKHITFGVDEFEGLWKLQFLHPFFFGNAKRTVTVYIVPPNSDYSDSEYKGLEVVEAGPNILSTIAQLIPTIKKYPYRWQLNGKKLDSFGYDLVTEMTKGGANVGSVDFTEIAYEEVKRYYDFEETTTTADIVIEDEQIVRNGALVKLGITLEKAQWANQISFDFFTTYPVEVASIMYQEDTAKYASTFEIPLDTVQKSASSLSITFPSVFAKRFVVVLAQNTYTVSNASVAIKKLSIEEVDEKEQVDTGGIDLLRYNTNTYLDETFDALWAEDTIAFQKNQIEASALSSTQSVPSTSTTEWRTEYAAAKKASKQKMETYEEQLREYQEAETKYKKDMEEYVKYQQQLADWYGRWGN